MSNHFFQPVKIGKETFHPQSYDENAFVMHYKMEPGGMVPPHLHIYMDEYFTVIKGEMNFKVNGETIVKKAGEQIMVPKGTTHAISNKGKEEVEMTVKYMPCADTHRLFEILAAFNAEKPATMMTMMKTFYVMHQLKLKPFSTPQPAFANSIMVNVVSLMGKLSGWDKLVKQFQK